MPLISDLQPLLNINQNQLNLEFSTSDSIDNKALAILAANMTLLIFMTQANLVMRWWGYVFCLGSYLVSLSLDIAAAWPREYSGAGVDVTKHTKYLGMDGNDLVLQLIADTQSAINDNRQINRLRLRLCVGSIVTTLLATAVLLLIIKA